ncbi:NACHT, LRR and PYD domains-containing protein 1b allele 3-like isoform X3 [Larus michahellis]|uniref:NACHT, LRR and PYD domains-containing protein 1b allele 3-like isoform X3 n=1 Tax=Larus michahellis TaxID=119627 RepID=UPI003D9BE7A4
MAAPEDDSPGEFHVFIKTSTGSTRAVRVSLDDTVREVNAKLEAWDFFLSQEGGSLTYHRMCMEYDLALSRGRGRLIYNERYMKDDLTLRHYGIKPNCFLYHVELQGPGGTFRPRVSLQSGGGTLIAQSSVQSGGGTLIAQPSVQSGGGTFRPQFSLQGSGGTFRPQFSFRSGGGTLIAQSSGKAVSWSSLTTWCSEAGGAARWRVWDLNSLPGGLALRELVPDEASTSAEVSYDFGQFHSSLNMDSPWKGNCQDCLGEDLPEVTPRRIRDLLGHHTAYRAHLPGAGIFRCSITGLGFEVKSAVTVTYRYDTWTTHLSKADQEMWMPAGPLFHIEVQPGVVQAVRLPHFICLAEDVNTSLCSIAHFESGKMTLESPTRLMAFSAVLENPSFSALGVLWRKIRSAFCSLPVHSLVLIFQQLNAASTTLHLYLIPDDKSVKRAIEEQEVNWNSKLIPKPPPFRPLFLGRNYRVTSTKQAEITPEEHLPLCYKSPKKQQPFVEIYIADMGGGTRLRMTDTRDGTKVWKASLRSGDIDHSARVFKASSGAAFLMEYKTALCSRMRQLPTILLHLRDADVINSDEEEEVLGQAQVKFSLAEVERATSGSSKELPGSVEWNGPTTRSGALWGGNETAVSSIALYLFLLVNAWRTCRCWNVRLERVSAPLRVEDLQCSQGQYEGEPGGAKVRQKGG